MRLSIGAVACCLLFCAPAAAGPPSGFTLRPLVTGLQAPTSFAFAPGGRIYVTEKRGLVQVFDKGRLHTFLDLRDQVNEYSDRGLLSIALDPSFARNRRLYLFYTEELRPDDPDKLHPASGRLISLRVSAANPDRPEPGSRVTLISGFDSRGPWHSVAGLAFDARGRLLAGFGDGSPYYPKDAAASAFRTYDLDVLGGKIVRIDRVTGRGVPDNPFYVSGRPGATRSKILAFGFRNPFRFTVDPTTGNVLVGDVGTDLWEEIDVVPAESSRPETELNFGWPCYEGGDGGKPARQDAYTSDAQCAARFYDREKQGLSATVPPRYAYSGKGGAAVVAGPVYRGGSYPAKYRGKFFFADFVRDRFWTLDGDKASDFGGSGGWGNPVAIGLTPGGALAYAAFNTGEIDEVVYVGGAGGEGVGAWVWVAVGAGAAAVLTAALWALRRRARA